MSQMVQNRSSLTQKKQEGRINPRIFLLSLGMFALGTDAFIVAGVLPTISHEMGVTESLTGRWPRVRTLMIALGAFCLLCRTQAGSDRRA